jgi:hypothetical protein
MIDRMFEICKLIIMICVTCVGVVIAVGFIRLLF